MSRILIHMDVTPNTEYDIFHMVDYEMFEHKVQNERNGDCPNIGNKLWFQGIISEIDDGINELFYYNHFMKKEEINENYDFIIAPMANVFSVKYIELLDSLTQKFENIKIPIYVIACGIQADSFDDLDEICQILKTPASKFIKTIYNTGGEFALRGYFTKEFFDRLGFKSAVATGCPSLFQIGSNLKIEKKNLQKNELKPMLNGNIDINKSIFKEYPDSEFTDQHMFYNFLYGSKFSEEKINDKNVKNYIKQFGLTAMELCSEQRINLMLDMPVWKKYLLDQKFNFSYGERIHGNIMPLLCGIPAVVHACDSRTREMAEFFELPIVKKDEKIISLYETYCDANFEKFNNSFEDKYLNFQNFLKEHGIIKKINTKNRFLDVECIDNHKENQNNEKLEQLRCQIKNNRSKYAIYDNMINLKRKMLNI